MKLLIFSSIILLLNINVYCQDKILEYKGTYIENSDSRFGVQAVYNYFENSNYERILN
jgi:hypothetical protein